MLGAGVGGRLVRMGLPGCEAGWGLTEESGKLGVAGLKKWWGLGRLSFGFRLGWIRDCLWLLLTIVLIFC